MNLREGTRRLALLLGAAGAIACGFLSYAQFQSTMRQRADHQRFEQLANSPVVRQARKSCFENSSESQSEENLPPLPKGAKLIPPSFYPDAPYCFIPASDTNETDYEASESNSAGIETIHFENREIASIETREGQILYPTPAPGAWSYFLIAILPVLGFFVPWGAVRAIGWVGSGFAQPVK